MRVNHNITSMTALRNLGITNQAAEKNLQRLSSGMKINAGADGPAELMISEQMRAQITGLNQAVKNSEIGVSMVQTAEGSLNEISSILINMRQLALHAANEGANDEKMLQADQNEVENLLSTLDRIARNTQFGTRTLFDGSNAATGVVVGDGLKFVSATEKTQAPPTKNGYEVDIKQVATRTSVAGTAGITIGDIEQGITFVLNEGDRIAKLDTKQDRDLSESVDALLETYRNSSDGFGTAEVENNIRGLVARALDREAKESGLAVDVFIDEIGMLNVRHQVFGSAPTFGVTSSISNILGKNVNEVLYSDGGLDVAGYIGGEIGVGTGQQLTGAPGTQVEGLTVQYDNVLERRVHDITDKQGNVIDQKIVQQSNDELVGNDVDGYVHVAQNSLTYQIGANYKQTVKFSLGDLRSEQLSQGVKNNSNYRSLADLDVTTGEGAQDGLLLIDKAIEEINELRANIGSFQKNALETNLRNLRVASEKLTSAESIIRDSDMAKEMSEFTKNQILLASGTAMAAQANQIPKSVMQLINGAQ